MRAGLPVDRTQDTVLSHSLESLKETQSFQNTSSDSEVVQSDLDGQLVNATSASNVWRGTGKTNLLHKSFTINDKHRSETYTLFFNKHTVVPANLVGCVTQQRDIDVTQTTILARYILPMPQRMFGVDRNEGNAAVSVTEFIIAVLEGNDLSRTDKGESAGYEEQEQPRCVRVGCAW